MSAQNMRGLTMFIGDIRNSKTQEKQQKRVDKELAHIRSKFDSASIDGYSLKKYVWKILYMYMMGYDADIGHVQAVQLISSPKYSEKSAGYMAVSLLLNENHDLLRLIIQQAKNDIGSRNEVHQCLALAAVANVGGTEFAESLTSDVLKIVVAGTTTDHVRKKASLCLLRLFRKCPEALPQEGWRSKLISLLDQENLGVLTSAMSLMLGLVSHDATGYEEAVPKVVRILTQVVFNRQLYPLYKYYHTVCPWLQVKCLRFLQYFPPPSDTSVMDRLNDVLHRVLTKTEVTKSVNKNNADHGVLFEAVNLIIHMCICGVKDLHGQAVGLLGKFISVREPNIRYLGLDTMTKLARVPDTLPAIRRHQSNVQLSLKDADISIRKRALDLLYAMCDHSNATEIVAELLKHLDGGDYSMKEELVLKVAILAEKFAEDLRWYIDTVLKLISDAGDFVSEDIWYRVIQIITNNDDLQEYAATRMLEALKSPNVHENGVRVGGYVLGEFGHLIPDEKVSGEELLAVLLQRFPTAATDTKAILLSAFVKMANTYPELQPRVNEIFRAHQDSADPELQQRAIEYAALNDGSKEKLMNAVFEIMPNFSERESALEKRLKRVTEGAADRDVWADEEKSDAKKNAAGEEEDEDESEDDSGEEGDASTTGATDVDDVVGEQKQQVVDILGFDTPGATSSSSSSSASASASSANADPGNLFDLPPMQSSSGLFAPQDEKRIDAMLSKTSGVVYENSLLQIGIKILPGAEGQAKMMLYYGNRSDREMGNVRCTAVPHQGTKLQVRPVEPITVAPKKQVPHYILWHGVRPYEDCPRVTIDFNFDGSEHQLGLKLPVVMTRFIREWEASTDEFAAEWKAHEESGETKVIQGKDVIPVDQLKPLVQSAFNVHIMEGVEKDDNNFLAAGTFCTTSKDQTGNPVTIRCLVRMETKENSKFVRVTVRSGHPTVTSALLFYAGVLLGAEQLK